MTSHLRNLRVDHLREPLAVPSRHPGFSWEIVSEERGITQSAYRIVVVDVTDPRHRAVAWDSELVESRATSAIRLSGDELRSAARFEWTALSRLSNGESIEASGAFETGPSDQMWERARWISRGRPPTQPVDYHPAPFFRGAFQLTRPMARVRVYATAGGVFELWVNGASVSPGDLAPGWTDYRFRVPFHAYDITEWIEPGSNTLGAILGEGWYSGYYGPFGKRALWGETPVFRAITLIEYEDGTVDEFVTGPDWECAVGPVLLAELLHGYRYDRRLELAGWSERAGRWDPVVIGPGPAGRLVPALIPAAGPIREVAAVAITVPLEGTQVIDFGQNLAGRVRLTATGPAGTTIRIRHAEILNPDGTVYTDNLRTASATDVVTLTGSGSETFEPKFTFHGFRYAEVTGYPGRLDLDAVVAVVVASIPGIELDLRTDSPLLDQIQSNLEWTMISNFLEVPTDCPNRDERLGWGGDAQIFAPTAMYNADVEAFFLKWLDDIADAQKPNGAFADIAPGVIVDFAEEGAAGYADAGVFLPWDLYQHYGDAAPLQAFFERSRAWLRYVGVLNPDYVWRNRRNADYGDWLSTVETDKTLTATAYWAHAAEVTAAYAEVLGHHEEATHYRSLHAAIGAAFRAEFVGSDGRIPDGTQTANILALRFGLLHDDEIPLAQRALCDDVERRGHITTGFLAVAHAYPALAEAGRPDLALRSLLSTESPSLGAQIARGMTTIGEHWSAWGEDGELLDPWMNSFNHFALGSVARWVYESVAGIAPAEPGFYSIRIEPVTEGPIGESRLAFHSPRGPIGCSWKRDQKAFELEIDIPANTRAVVRMPGREPTESGLVAASAPGVESVTFEGECIRIAVGSGRYWLRTVTDPFDEPDGGA